MVYIILKNDKEFVAFTSLEEAEKVSDGKLHIYEQKEYKYLIDFITTKNKNFAMEFKGPFLNKESITEEFLKHSIKSAQETDATKQGVHLKSVFSIINKKGELLYGKE